MEDDIDDLCASGLFPKLSFLLEEREETNLQAFFLNPKDNLDQNESGRKDEDGVPCPISVDERKQILEKILQKIEEGGGFDWWQKLGAKSRIKVILFLSESWDGLQLWSNGDCASLVVQICEEICKRLEAVSGDGDSVVEQKGNGLALWFSRNHKESLTPNETDFYHVLQSVRKKFNKEEWKYFPVSMHGFGWILQQISKPLLTDFIDMIIPPALLFSDDHYDDYKVLGLKMLAHIVDTSEKTHLIRNNWANVIYDAVQRHCTDKDPVVIELMMSILMKVLEIIEKDPSVHSSEFTKHDYLLKQILFQMEFSSDLNQKRTWLPILNTYMNKLGLATLHWSDRICDILRDCTICSDFNIWNDVIDVTATLIKNTWLKPDCESITEIILRVIFNVSSFHSVCVPDEEKKEIVEKASGCLQLLLKCDDSTAVESQLKEITTESASELLHPDFIKCLKPLLAKNS